MWEGQFESPSLTLPPIPYNASRIIVKLVKGPSGFGFNLKRTRIGQGRLQNYERL